MRDSSRIRPELVVSLLVVLGAALLTFVVLVEFARYAALFFCAILLAVALDAIGDLLRFRDRLPQAVGVALALGLIGVSAGGLVWWIAPQLVPQFEELTTQVPRGLHQARRWFESSFLSGNELPSVSEAAPSPEAMVENTGRFLRAGFSAVADVVVLAVIAIFLAASPERYRGGALRLLPPRNRRRGEQVLSAMAFALRRWLLARTILMFLVTVLLGAGLLLLDVPLAVPLAILAGLFSFVPYVGPAIALIPAFAVGLLKSPTHALYVAILYLCVQLIESYAVEPLIEGRAVSLPPALILAAQVVCAVWLGGFGVLLATPLLVVVVVAVQTLYLNDLLGEEVEVIGQK